MKTQLRISQIALVATAVGTLGLVLCFSGKPEPIYAGKPLSFWLDDYSAHSTPLSQSVAGYAFRLAGTNAIPTLLRALQAKDTVWKVKIFALLSKQEIVNIDPHPASHKNFAAVRIFDDLGPDAKAAVPALIDIYNRNISPASQKASVAALGAIGPFAKAALPALLQGMTNSDDRFREIVVETLGRIHSEPDLVVPVLINALRDPDSYVRYSTARALGRFGSAARPAVPALLKLFRDPNAPEGMQDPDQSVRFAAIHALGSIANRNDEPVIRALVAATKDKDATVRMRAGEALNLLDPGISAKARITNSASALFPPGHGTGLP